MEPSVPYKELNNLLHISYQNCLEKEVEVRVTALGSDEAKRLVQWSGMMLQSTPRVVGSNNGWLPPSSGVYCSCWCYGSPAHMYGVHATVWLSEMNGTAIPDLDTLLTSIRGLPKDEYVRLRLVDLKGQPKVVTLKPDSMYWSLFELRKEQQWYLVNQEGSVGIRVPKDTP